MNPHQGKSNSSRAGIVQCGIPGVRLILDTMLRFFRASHAHSLARVELLEASRHHAVLLGGEHHHAVGNGPSNVAVGLEGQG